VTANDGIKTGRGKHSAASVGWRSGWRGMEFSREINEYSGDKGVYIARISQFTWSRTINLSIGVRIMPSIPAPDECPGEFYYDITLQQCVAVAPLPSPEPPLGEIKVCSKTLGPGLAVHTYIVCPGNPACSGGPTGFFWDWGWPNPKIRPDNTLPPCQSRWGIRRGLWGPIDTYCGDYSPGHPGFPGRNKEHSCDTVYVGANASSICDCIRRIMNAIDNCCIGYELLGPNSNSVTYTALRNCLGVPSYPPYRPSLFGSPGWGTDLCKEYKCNCSTIASQ